MDERADAVHHAHRLWYHSTLGLRVIKKKKKKYASQTIFSARFSHSRFVFGVVSGFGVGREAHFVKWMS